jgi:hypothetical protein
MLSVSDKWRWFVSGFGAAFRLFPAPLPPLEDELREIKRQLRSPDWLPRPATQRVAIDVAAVRQAIRLTGLSVAGDDAIPADVRARFAESATATATGVPTGFACPIRVARPAKNSSANGR